MEQFNLWLIDGKTATKIAMTGTIEEVEAYIAEHSMVGGDMDFAYAPVGKKVCGACGCELPEDEECGCLSSDETPSPVCRAIEAGLGGKCGDPNCECAR